MTRTELHSLPGFHPASLAAAAAHLRESIRRPKDLTDTTTIVRNEGRLNGYLDALDDLVALTVKQPEKTEQKTFQPYSQPANETPNQKK